MEEARELGFGVLRSPKPYIGQDGLRRRAWVAQRLDTGRGMVELFAGQSDDEQLAALQAGVRRLLLAEDEVWFVHLQDKRPVADLLLTDADVIRLQRPLVRRD